MYKGKFFKIAYSIILVLIILFLLKQVDYIYKPLNSVLALLLPPLLISLFLYYLLRPMVCFLKKHLRFKSLAILITFLVIILIIGLISFFGGSIIQKQVRDLTHYFANYYESITNRINAVDNEVLLEYIRKYKIEEKLSIFVENLITGIKNNFFGFFSTVTNIGTIIVLIPLILYYFLKDDCKIYQGIISILPTKIKNLGSLLLIKIDKTLSRYISGQLIVAVILGVLTFIGYLIIGLPNALILALISMVTSFIPFIGAVIGALPAVLIGMTTSFLQVIKVLLVLVVVQQLEGNLITPRLQGSRLQIHPLIVILVVIAFFILFGFLGTLFAVPTYAAIRVLFKEIQNYKTFNT